MWGILYIYLTKSKNIIFKYTKTNNDIYIGDINSYGHKLIFKAKICGNEITPLYKESDFFNFISKRKSGVKWKMKEIIEIIMQ